MQIQATIGADVAARLDAINEFDRQPVSNDRVQGPGNFVALYAGEHLAGTEFVIGPLFVAHGVTAGDLIGGLLVGNLLAVLSWAFLVGPIATRTRLNLYWHLRKITGPNLLFLYNIVNALMFCFLAGAMISVAATAVGLPFDMTMPGLNDRYPNSVGWVVVVALVGMVVTAFGILGFERIAGFAKVASPWMLLVFVASAVAVLPRLGVESLTDFWPVANDRIWIGVLTLPPETVPTRVVGFGRTEQEAGCHASGTAPSKSSRNCARPRWNSAVAYARRRCARSSASASKRTIAGEKNTAGCGSTRRSG